MNSKFDSFGETIFDALDTASLINALFIDKDAVSEIIKSNPNYKVCWNSSILNEDKSEGDTISLRHSMRHSESFVSGRDLYLNPFYDKLIDYSGFGQVGEFHIPEVHTLTPELFFQYSTIYTDINIKALTYASVLREIAAVDVPERYWLQGVLNCTVRFDKLHNLLVYLRNEKHREVRHMRGLLLCPETIQKIVSIAHLN